MSIPYAVLLALVCTVVGMVANDYWWGQHLARVRANHGRELDVRLAELTRSRDEFMAIAQRAIETNIARAKASRLDSQLTKHLWAYSAPPRGKA